MICLLAGPEAPRAEALREAEGASSSRSGKEVSVSSFSFSKARNDAAQDQGFVFEFVLAETRN
jgi:hypothetical protein